MTNKTPGIGDNLDLHVKSPSLCENTYTDVVISKYGLVSSTVNEGYVPKKFTFNSVFFGFVKNRLFFNTYLEVPYYSDYDANSPFSINGDVISWTGSGYGASVIIDPLHEDYRTIHFTGTLVLSSTFTSQGAGHAVAHMPVMPYKDHPSLPVNDNMSYCRMEISSGGTAIATKGWFHRKGGYSGAIAGDADFKPNEEFNQLLACHFSASADATYTVQFWAVTQPTYDTSTVGTIRVGKCSVDIFKRRFGLSDSHPLYYSHVDYLSENGEVYYESGVMFDIPDIPHPPISLDGQVFLKNTVNQHSYTVSKNQIVLLENETQILDSTYVDGVSLASRSVDYTTGRVTGTAWLGFDLDPGFYQFTTSHTASIPGWKHLWATRERTEASGIYYYEGNEPGYVGKTYYNSAESATVHGGYYYIYVDKPRRYVTDRDNWSASAAIDDSGGVWWGQYKWIPFEQDGYTKTSDLIPTSGTGAWRESLRMINKRELDVDYIFYVNDDWGSAPPYIPALDIYPTHSVKTGSLVQFLITKPQKLWVKVKLTADLARLRVGYDSLLYDNMDVYYVDGIPTYIHSYNRGSSSIIDQVNDLIESIPSLSGSATSSIIETYQVESDQLIFPSDIGIYNISFRHRPFKQIRRGAIKPVSIQMSRDYDSSSYWHLPSPLMTSSAYHNYVQIDLSGSYPLYFWVPLLHNSIGVVSQHEIVVESSTGHIAYVNWVTSSTAGKHVPFNSHISNFFLHWPKYIESVTRGIGTFKVNDGITDEYVGDAWSGTDGDPNASNYSVGNGYIGLPTSPDWLYQIRSDYSTYWTSSVIIYTGACYSGIVPPMSYSGGVYTATTWSIEEVSSKLYENIPVSNTVSFPIDETSGWGQYTKQYVAEINGEIDYIPVTETPVSISSTCGIAKVVIDE